MTRVLTTYITEINMLIKYSSCVVMDLHIKPDLQIIYILDFFNKSGFMK